ncbi:MAG: hypothetical protein LQ340_006923 [Diploschistes diacapsis]|nr:MAG: hypothetical protein LQ340_006923 [Diploschistes diacapsis]
MALDNVKNILLVRYHPAPTKLFQQVLSGKGGVGKSSITTQLALSLSLAGHSVGVLDIDLTGPSIPRFLGIESAKIKQAPGGWLPVEVHPSHNLAPAPPSTYPSNHTTQNGVLPDPTAGTAHYNAPPADATAATSAPQHANPIGALYAMSLAFLLSSRSSAIVWRGPKKTAMVRQFLSDVLWPPLDFLLIDTPPGTSDEHISVVETLLNKVHNPATATPLAMNGANATEGIPVPGRRRGRNDATGRRRVGREEGDQFLREDGRGRSGRSGEHEWLRVSVLRGREQYLFQGRRADHGG